jgi:hypothetical protein
MPLVSLYTCEYVRMCPSLAPVLLEELQSCFILKRLSIVSQCLVNRSILAPNTGVYQMGSISETAVTILVEFQSFMEVICLCNTARHLQQNGGTPSSGCYP